MNISKVKSGLVLTVKSTGVKFLVWSDLSIGSTNPRRHYEVTPLGDNYAKATCLVFNVGEFTIEKGVGVEAMVEAQRVPYNRRNFDWQEALQQKWRIRQLEHKRKKNNYE